MGLNPSASGPPQARVARQAPGPRGLFLLGSILDFKRDILQAMARGQKEFGDPVRYRLGPVVVHGVSHPDLAEAVFMDGSNTFGKLGPDNPLRMVLGDGLLTSSDHESWFRHRKMMQPIFHRQRIATLYQKMVACAEILLAHWQAFKDGDRVDVHHEMMRVTLDIVSQTMFSANVMDHLDKIGPEAVNVTIDYAFQRLQNPFSVPASWPTPRNRLFRRVMRALDELLYGSSTNGASPARRTTTCWTCCWGPGTRTRARR
jgi:cytochrome P450